jgi:microcystin-dependent protein/acetyltransferase-like isoleucine patch superfamily enzyme
MASTYTTNLRLVKQGDGDNPNTWGQVLNDGVISLIDDAIAGYTTVSIGSAATVTLTENQGSGDQARQAILELKGTISDNVNILIPNNPKTYLVRNSVTYSSAGANVIMGVQGQTSSALVTIPTGGVFEGTGTATGTSFVLTNGTSVNTHDSFKNIVVDETVTVGGDATFKTNVSVSGNLTVGGSAVITGKVGLSNTLSVTNTAIFKSGVTILGGVHVSGNVCAAAYYGSGSNLTGLPSMPTGAIITWTVTAAPSGYHSCNGAAISRSTYSALFAIVSSLYGDGDGSSTFNVPDLRGRFMAGYNESTSRFTSVTTGMVVGTAIGNTGGVQAVTLTTAQMPSHTHSVPVEGSGSNDGIDIINAGNDGSVTTGATGGGGAHSNIPPVIMLHYMIKT